MSASRLEWVKRAEPLHSPRWSFVAQRKSIWFAVARECCLHIQNPSKALDQSKIKGETEDASGRLLECSTVRWMIE